jgi:hypothetical protein
VSGATFRAEDKLQRVGRTNHHSFATILYIYVYIYITEEPVPLELDVLVLVPSGQRIMKSRDELECNCRQ